MGGTERKSSIRHIFCEPSAIYLLTDHYITQVIKTDAELGVKVLACHNNKPNTPIKLNNLKSIRVSEHKAQNLITTIEPNHIIQTGASRQIKRQTPTLRITKLETQRN